jgi:hypothetical protein
MHSGSWCARRAASAVASCVRLSARLRAWSAKAARTAASCFACSCLANTRAEADLQAQSTSAHMVQQSCLVCAVRDVVVCCYYGSGLCAFASLIMLTHTVLMTYMRLLLGSDDINALNACTQTIPGVDAVQHADCALSPPPIHTRPPAPGLHPAPPGPAQQLLPGQGHSSSSLPTLSLLSQRAHTHRPQQQTAADNEQTV